MAADDTVMDFTDVVGDGKLVKLDVDFTETVDKAIPEAEKLAEAGKLQMALDQLHLIEKQTRIGADMRSNARIQCAIVKLCFDAKNWSALNDNIVLLSKKRSLIKQAITKMVQQCCTYVDKLLDKKLQLDLIDTLRTVTAGKIYVEVERARLTLKLVKMKEAEGNIDEAATLLLELQVETYGSMDKKEKVELLLEQMRLSLARKDFTRAQIISRKIAVKFFQDNTSSEVQLLKLKFYQLMIEVDQHDSQYLSICKHYLAVCDTPIVKQDPDKLQEALKSIVIYILLAQHDNDQHDLLQRIKLDKQLDVIPTYKELINLFCIDEIIDWKDTIMKNYETILVQGTPAVPASGIFDKTEAGRKRWEDMKTRVIEHNIRVVAKYYSRITIKRLSQLLDLPEKNTEEMLCKMVVDGTIPGAKIDRPTGIVNFHPRELPTETLDNWANNVTNLMGLLNKCSHLILKEEMVHKHLHQVDQKA